MASTGTASSRKRRFLDLLRERFNSAVGYKGRGLKWDTVIEQKTVELGRYLVGRTSGVDLSEPQPNLHRVDDSELRTRILSLTQQKATKLGIGKSVVYYLRRNAISQRPFRVYRKIRKRLK